MKLSKRAREYWLRHATINGRKVKDIDSDILAQLHDEFNNGANPYTVHLRIPLNASELKDFVKWGLNKGIRFDAGPFRRVSVTDVQYDKDAVNLLFTWKTFEVKE